MNVFLHIPDTLAARLAPSDDVARQALEALALDAYRAGRLTEAELQDVLGLQTRYELDGFLNERACSLAYDMSDFDRERHDLNRLEQIPIRWNHLIG